MNWFRLLKKFFRTPINWVYNKSAKRQCHLQELAEKGIQQIIEDAAIQVLENVVEEPFEQGISY